MSPDWPPTPGLLLAGGLAQRMGGGDKSMRTIGGRSILSRVVARLESQCDGLLLNANGDPARFSAYRLPVIADTVSGYPGPLAGILAGLDWLADNRPDAEWMLSAAADCPFLPRDLVTRLHAARAAQNARIAAAASGGRTHPVIGLWPVSLRNDLRKALTTEGLRAVGGFVARHDPAIAAWPTVPLDPFFNANSVADIAAAEQLATLDER